MRQNTPIPNESFVDDPDESFVNNDNDESGTGDESCQTALLLLDFQNEFLKKGGKLHNEMADTIETTGVLQNVTKLVECAREMDAMIIYSPVVMKEDGTFNGKEGTFNSKASVTFAEKNVEYSEQYGLFTENTWNCEIIHEVEPRNDDIILRDRCGFSAFAGTKLLSYLRDNNVKHFFVAGFLTDVCVYQTSTAAAKLLPDMSTYVLSDSCAAKSMDEHNNALEKIAKKSVNVILTSKAESIFEECSVSMKKQVLDGSDEWLMIEKIFSAGGVGTYENMDVDTLQSLIKSMPSSSSILSAVTQSLSDSDEKQISRTRMHKILFERKPRSGFLENFSLFIVMGYLPFLYSISTRIPFIFVALEITEGRGRELWEVGLVLGAYQTSRALGNLIIVIFGGNDPFKRLQILLSFSALFGWLFLSLFGRPEETSLFSFKRYLTDTDDGDIAPLFALFCVGLGESIVILQRSVMMETARESPSGTTDESLVANRLSLQYSMVAFGSVSAYILGGWLYNNYGYYAVCDFGILVQISHLIGAVVYRFLLEHGKKSLMEDELDGNDLIRSIIFHFQAVSTISKYSRDVANGSENAMSAEKSGFSAAATKAKSDRLLNHSLGKMYQHFFAQKRDDVLGMEELIRSTDQGGTGTNGTSIRSKRPLVMAIGKHKLSKLVLFLMKSKGEGRLTEREFVSFWGPHIYMSMFESSQEASVTVIWPYMRAVVATQAIAALCIGIFLSTALLSYTQRFPERCSASTVGILLGTGEAFGMIVIFFKSFRLCSGKSSKSNNDINGIFKVILKAIISRPLNVPFILMVCSICSMLFSVDNFVVAVIFQIMYSSVNDLSVSFMNELISTSIPSEQFKYYQGIGQWLRRLGNMITAILGPIFFGIDEKLPFLFFGGVVLIWAFTLWVMMYMHAKKIHIPYSSGALCDDSEGSKKYNDSCLARPFVPFMETSSTPWHILEQRYFALNKDRLEEELISWKKASVDISVMEHRIRRIAAALEVEKDQRRALEDRLYARISSNSCNEPEAEIWA